MPVMSRAALVLALLVFTPASLALGLGSLDSVPRLGAPIALDIAVSGSGVVAEDLRVDVPGYSEHLRLGADDPIVPRGLRADVVSEGGRTMVRLRTRERVMEPVLRFLVRLRWRDGEQIRAYEVLLDPPLYTTRTPSSAETVAGSGTPARSVSTVAAATPPRSSTVRRTSARAGERYGPVAAGETLGSIVRSAYASIDSDLSRVVAQIVSANPTAFINGNPDLLLQGAVLVLPAAAALDAPARSTAIASATTSTRTSARYGPVRAGQTLYSIAREVSGAPESRIGGIARQLYETNPQAFVGNDMHRLKVGAVLDVPAELGSATRLASGPAAATRAVGPTIGAATAAASNDLVQPSVGSAGTDTAADVSRMREVLAEERSRTEALSRQLDSTLAELATLEERAEALGQEIERKSALLAERTTALATRGGDSVVKPIESTTTAPERLSAAASTASPVAAAAASTVAAPATSGQAAPSTLDAILEEISAMGTPILIAIGAAMVLLLIVLWIGLRRHRSHAGYRDPIEDAVQVEAIRERLAADDDDDELFGETTDIDALDETDRVVAAGPAPESELAEDDTFGTLVLTDAAKANRLARQAAVCIAYEDYVRAKRYIDGAIKLEPHRHEHKMVLLTLYQCLGDHATANALIDDLIARREQLSGELRAHVEELSQRRRH